VKIVLEIIQVDPAAEDQLFLKVSVEDTGAGIKEED